MYPNLKFVLNLDLASKLSQDLVPFVQFRKGEKRPWRSVAKVTLLYECFYVFKILPMVPNRATRLIYINRSK